MKTLKLSVLLLLSILIVSTTGCVTVTGEMDPEKSAFISDETIPASNPLYHSINIGEVEGFEGTSVIILTGNTNPNLTNESARVTVSETLETAGMLSENQSAPYNLDIKMVDSGEFSLWSMGVPDSRTTVINYTLTKKAQQIYSKNISGTGKTEGSLVFHLVERRAAEKAMRNGLEKLVADLKALPAD